MKLHLWNSFTVGTKFVSHVYIFKGISLLWEHFLQYSHFLFNFFCMIPMYISWLIMQINIHSFIRRHADLGWAVLSGLRVTSTKQTISMTVCHCYHFSLESQSHPDCQWQDMTASGKICQRWPIIDEPPPCRWHHWLAIDVRAIAWDDVLVIRMPKDLAP